MIAEHDPYPQVGFQRTDCGDRDDVIRVGKEKNMAGLHVKALLDEGLNLLGERLSSDVQKGTPGAFDLCEECWSHPSGREQILFHILRSGKQLQPESQNLAVADTPTKWGGSFAAAPAGRRAIRQTAQDRHANSG